MSSEENLRADYFYLAQTNINCYKCNKITRVHVIVLSKGFESVNENSIDKLDEAGIPFEGTLFCTQGCRSIISYVVYISLGALEEIYKYVDYRLYRKEYSGIVDYEYYRSIRTYCNAAQGNNFIISDF